MRNANVFGFQSPDNIYGEAPSFEKGKKGGGFELFCHSIDRKYNWKRRGSSMKERKTKQGKDAREEREGGKVKESGP